MAWPRSITEAEPYASFDWPANQVTLRTYYDYAGARKAADEIARTGNLGRQVPG